MGLISVKIVKLKPSWRNMRVGGETIDKSLDKFPLLEYFPIDQLRIRQWVGVVGDSEHFPFFQEIETWKKIPRCEISPLVIRWGVHGLNSLDPLGVRLCNQGWWFTLFTIHGSLGSTQRVFREDFLGKKTQSIQNSIHLGWKMKILLAYVKPGMGREWITPFLNALH